MTGHHFISYSAADGREFARLGWLASPECALQAMKDRLADADEIVDELRRTSSGRSNLARLSTALYSARMSGETIHSQSA